MSEASAPPRPLTHYALLSVAAAVATFALKLVAWHVTGSVSLLSDALESVANLVAAFIAMASLAVAARPADDDHPFGHTKVEYFAGGVEGAIIMIAAAGIGWNAVERFFAPQTLTEPVTGIAFAALASLVNLAVGRLLLRVGRARRSIALEADAKHLLTDVWTSGAAVLAVILVTLTGWQWLDPALGLLLAVHIVFTGVKLVHQSMLGLIDTGLPAAELAEVRRILDEHSGGGVTWHALRTREAGSRRFLSVHVLVPGEWTVTRAHDLAEEIEKALRDAIPQLTAVTHLEPVEDPASWQDVDLDRP